MKRFSLQSYPCALCGSAARTVVMNKRGVVDDREFNIVRCKRCRHHYVDPRISDEQIPELYDEAYFRAGGFDANTNYYVSPSEYSIRVAHDVAQTVSDALGKPLTGMRVLDFGCGPGHLLTALVANRADAVGFDDSAAAIDICTERHLPVTSFDQLANARGTFDVVCSTEVIEHVPDPLGFLETLTSLLKVGGVLYVQTGNWNLVRRIAGTPYVMPEGHIHYFTPPEVRRMFARLGLQEVFVLNRSWFPYRDGPSFARSSLGTLLIGAASAFASRLVPAYAAFPIGKRVR